MKAFDSATIQTLLYDTEGTTLDFKSEQYAFEADNAGTNNIGKKSELLKDILAFANAWKKSDAHIIIGVEDGKGGRAVVRGIDRQLDDAAVQQFVNEKTNTDVTFEYVPTIIDGLPCAIIWVAKEQKRPIYLKKRFGALEEESVFIRRGSSTTIASPEEIANIGEARVVAAQQPRLTLRITSPGTPEPAAGQRLELTSVALTEQPPPPARNSRGLYKVDFGDGQEHDIDAAKLRLRSTIASFGRPSPEVLFSYRRSRAALVPIVFIVRNDGPVTLSGVNIEARFPDAEVLTLKTHSPSKPVDAISAAMNYEMFSPELRVGDDHGVPTVRAHIGKVQPGAESASEPFWLSSSIAQTLTLTTRVYADNLAPPQEGSFAIDLRVVEEVDQGDEDGSASR